MQRGEEWANARMEAGNVEGRGGVEGGLGAGWGGVRGEGWRGDAVRRRRWRGVDVGVVGSGGSGSGGVADTLPTLAI